MWPPVSTIRKPTDNPCWICRGSGMRPKHDQTAYVTCQRCRGTGVERN